MSQIQPLPNRLAAMRLNRPWKVSNDPKVSSMARPRAPDGGGAPSGPLGEAIDAAFGSFENFRGRFDLIAANLVGSGWIWLILTRGKLVLYTLPNHDSPLLVGERPLLGLDLWEHAYCTEHQWRQSDYVDTFWNIVDWSAVGRRYEAARAAAAQRRCHQPQPA